MPKSLHETLGLSSGPPRWLRRVATTLGLIGIFVFYGFMTLRSPEHVAYLEAVIVETPTINSGLIKGEIFTASLPEGQTIAIHSSLRMPEAKEGDQVCLQQLTDSIRGGTHYRTAPARFCGPEVTVTYFRVM